MKRIRSPNHRIPCLSVSVVLLALSSSALAAVRLQSFEDRDREDRKSAPAVFECAPGQLGVEVQAGGAAEAKLTVRNAGGSVLKWRVVAPRWVKCTPPSGALEFEGSQVVALKVDASSLEPGTIDELLTFAAPGASNVPPEVAIRVTVTPRPQPEEPPEPPPAEPSESEPLLTETIEEPPPADEPVEPPPVPVDDAGRGRMGCHAGVMLPGAGKLGGFGLGYAVDVFYRSTSARSRFGYEIAIGVGGSESENGFESSTLTTGSASAIVHLTRGERSSVYALAGMSIAAEESVDSEAGTTSSMGSLVDVGLGGTFGQRFDARLKYSQVIGSENVDGIVGVLAGVSF